MCENTFKLQNDSVGSIRFYHKLSVLLAYTCSDKAISLRLSILSKLMRKLRYLLHMLDTKVCVG